MTEPLEQAIAAIRAGDVETGKRLLAQAIAADPRNESAWLWLSEIVGSDEQRRQCLERVLSINPDQQAARRRLQALQSPATAAAPPPTELTLPRRRARWQISSLHVIIIAALGLAAAMIVARAYTSQKPDPQKRSSSVAAELHTRLCAGEFSAAHELVYLPDLEFAAWLDALPGVWSPKDKCAPVASAFSQPVNLPQSPGIYQVALTLKNGARVGLFTRRHNGKWYVTRSLLLESRDSWTWSPEAADGQSEND